VSLFYGKGGGKKGGGGGEKERVEGGGGKGCVGGQYLLCLGLLGPKIMREGRLLAGLGAGPNRAGVIPLPPKTTPGFLGGGGGGGTGDLND